MPPNGMTTRQDIQAAAREIDFVTSFSRNLTELLEIWGVSRPIQKALGTKLVHKYAEGVINLGKVGEGETIPLSQMNVKTKEYGTMDIDKWRKSVTMEAIADHGYPTAISLTDEAFRNEIINNILDYYYAFLWAGQLKGHAANFKAALAMTQGRVRNRWKQMRRDITNIVGYCNIEDAYTYLGDAQLTTQTAFGLNYIKGFLGFNTLFLLSDNEIPRGNVVATPARNIITYYANPADAGFAAAGLTFRVDPDLPVVGFHAKGEYYNVTSETIAVSAMTLFAEYLDGIAVVDFGDTEFNDVTVAAKAGDASIFGHTVSDLQSGITVQNGRISGTLKYVDSGALPARWGPGNFLALDFDGMSTGSGVSVKVGLVPSQGSGFATLDADKDAAMKISNPQKQRLEVITTNGATSKVQSFDLSGLTLEGPNG